MIDSIELIDEAKIAEFKELYNRIILENDGVFPRDKVIEELFCKMEDVALEIVYELLELEKLDEGGADIHGHKVRPYKRERKYVTHFQ